MKANVCVKKCPGLETPEDIADLKCKPTVAQPDCMKTYTYTFTETPLVEKTMNFRYPTKAFIGKFCFPDATKSKEELEAAGYPAEAAQAILDSMDNYKKNLYTEYKVDTYSQYMKDVIVSWWAILISAVVAFLLGFVYMLIVFCCAKILVWIVIVLLLLLLLAGFLFCFFYADQYDSADNTYKTLKYGSYAILGVLVIYAVIICCCIR